MHQKTYRRRSWENVFDEIEALPVKLDKTVRLHFCDERFLPNAQGFLEEKQKRGLEFTFYTSARLDHLVEYKDALKPLWEAGLKRVEGGIESPSQNDAFKKGYGKDTIREAFKTISSLWKQDVRLDHEFYGIGFTKDTTLESLRDDCLFYKKLFKDNWQPYLADRWLSRCIKELFGTMKLDYGTLVFKEYYTEFKQHKGVYVFGQTYKLHVPADKPDPAWKEELEEALRRSNKNRFALQIFWTANPDLEAIQQDYHDFLRGPMKQIEDKSYALTRAFLERDFINNQPESQAARMECGVAYHLNKLEMAPLYYLQDLAEGFLHGKEGPNDPRLIERMLEKADRWIALLKRFKKTCNVPIPKQLSD